MSGGNMGQLALKLTADTRDLNKGLDGAKGGLKSFGKTAALSLGAAGVAVGALAIAGAAAALKIGTSFDDAYDTIRLGTGKTGVALAGLQEDFKKTMGRVPSEMGEVGTAIADLNTRLGLTGKPLQDMSEQMLNLSRITKTDVSTNIAVASRVMGDWGVAAGDQSKTMDMLFRATQESGLGFDVLSKKLVQFGAPMRQMGFSVETSTALLAKWEKEGVNTETILGALKIGVANFARSGVDAEQGLNDFVKQINKLGPGAEATTLAMEVFGARAGPDMVAAVLEGRFAIEDYVAAIAGGEETINGAAAATNDWRQSLQILKNKGLLLVEPIATKVFTAFGHLLSTVAIPAMDALIGWVDAHGPQIDAFVNGIGRGFEIAATMIAGAVRGIITILGWMKPAFDSSFGWLLPGGLIYKGVALFVGAMSRVGNALGVATSTFKHAREQWGMGLFKSVLYGASEFPYALSKRLAPVSLVMQDTIDKVSNALGVVTNTFNTAREKWGVDLFTAALYAAADFPYALSKRLAPVSLIALDVVDAMVPMINVVKSIGSTAAESVPRAIGWFHDFRDEGQSLGGALVSVAKQMGGEWKDFVSEGIIHNDNLRGSFDRLKTVGADLFTNLKETAVPRLESFAEGVKGFFERALAYVQENGPALFERITGTVLRVADWLIANVPAFIAKGRELVFNFISGALDWLTANGASLIAGFNNLVQKAVDWLTSDQARELLIGGAVFMLKRFIGFWPIMLMQFGPQIVSAISKMVPPLLQGLADMLPPLVKAAGVMLRELVGNMAVLLRDLIPKIGETLRELTPVLAESLRTVVSAIGPVIRELIPVLIDLIVIVLKEGIPLVLLVIKELGLLMGAVLKEMPGLLWVIIRDVGTIIPQMLIKALGEQLGALGQKMGEIFILIRDFFFGLPGRVFGAIASAVLLIFARFKSAITDGRTLVNEGTRDVFLGIKSFFTGLPGRLIGAIVQMGKEVFSAVRDALPSLGDIKNMLTDRIKGAWEGSKSTLSKLNPANWSIPGFQHGGVVQQTGLALVGEAGPELVNLPRGARVFSNEDLRKMLTKSGRGGEVRLVHQFEGLERAASLLMDALTYLKSIAASLAKSASAAVSTTAKAATASVSAGTTAKASAQTASKDLVVQGVRIAGADLVAWNKYWAFLREHPDWMNDWLTHMSPAVKDIAMVMGKKAVGAFRQGGLVPRSGLALVGEGGPELVNLPRGARVFNNEDSMTMLGGGGNGGVHVTQNFYGPTSPSEQQRVAAREQRRLALEQGARL